MGDGTRRLKFASSGDEIYRWDPLRGQMILREEGANLQETFVHGPGGVLAQIEGSSAAEYALHDHLGSVREWRNASGELNWAREYTPYGGHHRGSVGPSRFMFTGHPWDAESQLYHAPFRAYSPAMARWTTRDPLGMVDGPNVYAYVRGNPVMFVDPLGLSAVLGVNNPADNFDAPVGGPRVDFCASYVDKVILCFNDCLGVTVAVCTVWALTCVAAGGLAGYGACYAACLAGGAAVCALYCGVWGHRYYP